MSYRPWVTRHRVGKCHVGESYQMVVRFFISVQPAAWRRLHPHARMKFVRQIIAEHDENRRLYSDVMGARI